MLDRDFGYRREAQRLNCPLVGNYVAANGISYQVKCQDISNKGLGLEISTPLQIDSQVKIELSTKRRLSVLLTGRVRWCNKISEDYWRTGVVFNKILPFDLKNIV